MKDVKKEIKGQMKDTPDLCTRYYMLEDWYTALAYDAEAKNPKDDKFTDLDDKTESDVPFRGPHVHGVRLVPPRRTTRRRPASTRTR